MAKDILLASGILAFYVLLCISLTDHLLKAHPYLHVNNCSLKGRILFRLWAKT